MEPMDSPRNQGNFFSGAQHMSFAGSTITNIARDAHYNYITSHLQIFPENKPKEITADDLLLQTPQVPDVFTGRSHLVEEAVNILCGTKQVHIAILGAGGIGKTSVALYIMENPLVKEKFAERCYFIPCEMLPDAMILIQGLVQAIGLQVTQGKDSFKFLLDKLRGGQRVLLVLDNFETPWGSKGQTEVNNLIEMICRCRSVSVIVTMRGTEGPGQIKWHKLGGGSGLPALELGAAKEAFCSFCSDANLTIEEDDPILENLLIQMDGMPLAIMLMAQLAREWPLKNIMERWSHQKTAVLKKFGLGQQENRLTSIEVSIKLTLNIVREKLSPTGEEVLRLVALLPSGIPHWLENLPKMLPDATMDLDDSTTQALILKKACLIYETGDKTLKILTPIGEYIMKSFQERDHLENQVWVFYESFINNLPLTPSEEDGQLGLHIGNIYKILEIQIKRSFERSHMNVLQQLYNYSQYFSGLVPLVGKYLRWKSQLNLSDQTEVMFMQESMLSFMGEYRKAINIIHDVEELYKHQINQETSNVEVVTSSDSISRNNTFEQIQAECYKRLGGCLYHQGRHTQSKQKVQQAKNLYEKIGSRLGAAQCLQSLGDISSMLSQYEDAKVMLEQAKEQFEGVGDMLGAVQCLQSLGNIYRMQSQYEDAKVMLEEAKEQFEGVGDRLGAAQCLQSLGNICRMLSQYEDAKVMLEEAKGQLEGVGDRLGAVQCLQSLGNIYRMQSQYEDAKIMLEEAKEQFEGVGDRLGAARCLQSLGNICRMLDQYEDAKVMLEEAKEQFEGVGSRLGAAQCLQSLADICKMLDQYEDAKVMLEQAKEQFEGVGSRLGAAQCLQSLGDICKMLDQYEDAKVMLEQAKEQFESVGDRLGAAQCLQSLGDICKMLSQYEDAKVTLEQAKEQFEGVASRLGAAQCLQSLGDICRILSQYEDAKVMLEQAKEQFEQITDRLGTAQCLHSLGRIDHEEGHLLPAKAKFEEAKEYFEAIQIPKEIAICEASLQQLNHELAE
ncbi:hypothetical protein D9758_009061 [Tetrapyrgos nigripes]|uniref:TPR-like protein n=1 Tax=Tetrapyrgos nigripes TaxID=182062 RepID=A0A8H5LL33_9AGAR|nr:hypothetical protein D9758_009061 [Tetrapyrgos nigripes]